MFGLSAGSGTKWAGGCGIAIWEWTLRSVRTCTSSPAASMRQPLSPSSCSEAMTTEAVRSSPGTCTDDDNRRVLAVLAYLGG